MKNWKKIALFSSASLLVFGSLFASSLAWFSAKNQATLNSGIGYTASSYFASGDGTAADPYVINKPIHLYNLAWLQYLGYFNKVDNGAVTQTYFALGADVDMASTSTVNWTLPPIGTTTNPFVGNFDGKNYVISNLKVDNVLGEGHITRKPASITTAQGISGVNIVGAFGVVGQYNDVPSATFNNSVVSVKDVYLNNITVKSSLDSTLIGVAAGYVNAAVSGVGVAASHLDINSGATAFSSALTSHISDYSTIGYATSAYKADRQKSTTEIKNVTSANYSFTAQEAGSVSGWGGSIDMKSLYTRLASFRDDASSSSSTVTLSGTPLTQTISINIAGSSSTTTDSTYPGGQYKQYYDATAPLKGSYSFSYYNSSSVAAGTAATDYDFIYLYGAKTFTKTVTTNTAGSYKIATSGTYLSYSGTSLSSTTTAANAPVWSFSTSAGNGVLSTIINSTTYYLYNYSGTLYFDTDSSSATSWTFSGGKLSNYDSYYGSTYYLYYSSGWFLSTRSSKASTFTITTVTAGSSSSATVSNGVTTRDTYFPLNVDSNNLPTQGNTGYVIGGSTYNSSTYYKSGDSRVSRYFTKDIYVAMNGSSSSNTAFTDSKLEVVTRTKSSGAFVRVSDDYNASNTANTTLSSKFTTKTAYASLGLQKYAKSRTSLGTVLAGDTNKAIYGMHFMDASVSKANLVTASATRIQGTDYTNYEMPRDSIDFNLQRKGYINFFAGTYFSNNDSFFSLHKITRTAAGKIDTIKEISKVYSNNVKADPYVYLYSDGTYSSASGTLPTDYTNEIFDTSWISNPGTTNWINNAVYYFEVPVNDGEYCLGSVSGHTGAYLLYLDISANAQQINRTAFSQYVVTTSKTYEYPKGVAMVVAPSSASKEIVNALASAAVALNSGYSGTMSFTKSDTTISFESTSDSFYATFQGDDITLARVGSSTPPTLTAKASYTDEIKRVTYLDYNTTTETTSTTVVTDTITQTSSGTSETRTLTDGTGAALTSYAANDGTITEFGTGSGFSFDVSGNTTDILSYSYSYDADKSTITFAFTLTTDSGTNTTFNGEDFKTYAKTGFTVSLATTTDPLSVNVTLKDSTYTITINGTTVAVGTVVAVSVTA